MKKVFFSKWVTYLDFSTLQITSYDQKKVWQSFKSLVSFRNAYNQGIIFFNTDLFDKSREKKRSINFAPDMTIFFAQL